MFAKMSLLGAFAGLLVPLAGDLQDRENENHYTHRRLLRPYAVLMSTVGCLRHHCMGHKANTLTHTCCLPAVLGGSTSAGYCSWEYRDIFTLPLGVRLH